MRIEQGRAGRAGGIATAAAKGQGCGSVAAFSGLLDAEQPAAAPGVPPSSIVSGVAVLPHPWSGGEVTDREARRHGSALLRALAGLQLDLLGEAGDGASHVRTRRTLADLARAMPAAQDPGLDQILRAIAQRAAIELARLEHHPIERSHPSDKDARQNKELEDLQ